MQARLFGVVEQMTADADMMTQMAINAVMKQFRNEPPDDGDLRATLYMVRDMCIYIADSPDPVIIDVMPELELVADAEVSTPEEQAEVTIGD